MKNSLFVVIKIKTLDKIPISGIENSDPFFVHFSQSCLSDQLISVYVRDIAEERMVSVISYAIKQSTYWAINRAC